jgi:hypothetical protein
VGTNAAWATDRGEPIVQAMLDHLRATNVLLKGSNIWVAGSRDYRAFEDYLLPAEALRDVTIEDEAGPERYIAGRAAALHERLNFVAAGGRPR